jgi:hypothetical protein
MRKRREWERWEKFERNNSRQRIDEKRGGEGLYLYLGSKSYPSWMLSKCQSLRNIEHLKEGGCTS